MTRATLLDLAERCAAVLLIPPIALWFLIHYQFFGPVWGHPDYPKWPFRRTIAGDKT